MLKMSVILMNNLNDSGKNYYIELTGSGQYSITTDPSRARLFKNITKAQGAMSSFSKILRKYEIYTSLKRKRRVPFSHEWLIILNSPISLVLFTCAPIHAHIS